MRRSSKHWNLQKKWARAAACLGLAVIGLGPAAPAFAQTAASLTLELNKLEPQDKSCRAYFVIDNPGDKSYVALKADVVIFQPDGVISRRVALDLAPVKAAKQSVKQFDFDGLVCDKVGRVLVNEIVECKLETGAAGDCLSSLSVKSLVSGVALSK